MNYIHEHGHGSHFDRVFTYTTGLWAIRLLSTVETKFDHAVLLDSSRRLIIDPAESFAIRAAAEILWTCAGPNIEGLQLAEILEIFK